MFEEQAEKSIKLFHFSMNKGVPMDRLLKSLFMEMADIGYEVGYKAAKSHICNFAPDGDKCSLCGKKNNSY